MKVQTAIPSQEQIKWATALMKRCPQFQVCNCNDCPLDPSYEQRGPRDKEHRCRARKSTRLRIVAEAADEGLQVKLPYGGLTHQEYANQQHSTKAKAYWEALPTKNKAKRLSNLQPYGSKNR